MCHLSYKYFSKHTRVTTSCATHSWVCDYCDIKGGVSQKKRKGKSHHGNNGDICDDIDDDGNEMDLSVICAWDDTPFFTVFLLCQIFLYDLSFFLLYFCYFIIIIWYSYVLNLLWKENNEKLKNWLELACQMESWFVKKQ